MVNHYASKTLILLSLLVTIPLILSFSPSYRISSTRNAPFKLSVTSSITTGSAPQLESILKKPSKVLTVGVELDESIRGGDLSMLSMQLRKSKVSAIYSSNLDQIEEIAKEQETARGNFPGPLPIIYTGNDYTAAVENGACAVILSVSENDDLPNVETEVIWKVSTIDQVDEVMQQTGNTANAFMIDSNDDIENLISNIPDGSLCIAAVEPMQPDEAEISQGKEFKRLGCASILILKACVGDSEDLPYAQYIVHGLTSKASSQFKFTGLTGKCYALCLI